MIPFLLALFQLGLQMAFHGNYGYFRDELYYIACTKHLAFGYVDHPPLSIFMLWLNRLLLGDSLYALRLIPSVLGACVVVLAAMIARKLGGGNFAQALASLSIVAAPGLFGHAQLYSPISYDVFFWTAAGYFAVSILSDDNPKMWIPFGLIVGLSMLNKYTMGFLVAGLITGLLLTQQRKQFLSKWFWLGGALGALVFLPHLIWEITLDFATLEFLRNASANKNLHLGQVAFFIGQLRDMNVLSLPLWLGGIYFFFKYHEGKYRALGWLFPFVFEAMVFGNGKIYYMSSIFPLFLAAGSVLFEHVFEAMGNVRLKRGYVIALIISGVISLPFALPFLTIEQFISYQQMLGIAPRPDEKSGVAELPQYLADQFGWKELVDTIVAAYKKLTPEERSQCVIFARDYGQAAAVDFFGKQYGMPDAICGHNSYWLWGPGKQSGNIAIIIGSTDNLEANLNDLRSYYKSVEFVAKTDIKYVMPFEKGRMIFICKGMNTAYQKIWAKERFYI